MPDKTCTVCGAKAFEAPAVRFCGMCGTVLSVDSDAIDTDHREKSKPLNS